MSQIKDLVYYGLSKRGSIKDDPLNAFEYVKQTSHCSASAWATGRDAKSAAAVRSQTTRVVRGWVSF